MNQKQANEIITILSDIRNYHKDLERTISRIEHELKLSNDKQGFEKPTS